eukprot:Hpha_TRINITY_DN18554_c0_g1::TRINITY_DN18554_c0_g1_i1::g.195095::m.195095
MTRVHLLPLFFAQALAGNFGPDTFAGCESSSSSAGALVRGPRSNATKFVQDTTHKINISRGEVNILATGWYLLYDCQGGPEFKVLWMQLSASDTTDDTPSIIAEVKNNKGFSRDVTSVLNSPTPGSPLTFTAPGDDVHWMLQFTNQGRYDAAMVSCVLVHCGPHPIPEPTPVPPPAPVVPPPRVAAAWDFSHEYYTNHGTGYYSNDWQLVNNAADLIVNFSVSTGSSSSSWETFSGYNSKYFFFPTTGAAAPSTLVLRRWGVQESCTSGGSTDTNITVESIDYGEKWPQWNDTCRDQSVSSPTCGYGGDSLGSVSFLLASFSPSFPAVTDVTRWGKGVSGYMFRVTTSGFCSGNLEFWGALALY